MATTTNHIDTHISRNGRCLSISCQANTYDPTFGHELDVDSEILAALDDAWNGTTSKVKVGQDYYQLSSVPGRGF